MPYHKGILPREGFVGDFVLRILGRTVFSPSALLAVLLLARYTKRGRDLAVLHESSYRRVHKLLYLALALKISGWLSKRALNNGRQDKYDWSREIVLVTGGSAGIGGEMVKLLDEQGIKVVVIDVQPLSFRASGRVHYFPCDIRSPEKVQAAAAAIRAKVGNPTVLINNAGVARGKSVLEATPGDVRFTFDVNTLAHYWLAQAFLPSMVKANHGMIVTVASVASFVSTAKMVDYSASKAAALAFHEGLTAELPTVYGADRVRTVVVHPAHIKTALFKGFDQHSSFLTPSLHPQTVAEAVVRQVLSGHSGQIVLPQTARGSQMLRLLPFWLSHGYRIDAAKFMKKWDGRQVIKDVDADVDAGTASDSTVLVDKS